MKHNIKEEDYYKSGIYKIINTINNKYYLGCTQKLYERYKDHYKTLSKGKSGCSKLQNAVIKYGLDNFEFVVQEICENYKEREISLLSENFPDYNIVKETLERRIISDETRLKMSKSQKGRIPWNKNKKGLVYKKRITGYKTNKSSRKIKSTNLITGEIIIHDSVKTALQFFGFKSKQSIYSCCSGRQNSVFNIKFEYYSEP